MVVRATPGSTMLLMRWPKSCHTPAATRSKVKPTWLTPKCSHRSSSNSFRNNTRLEVEWTIKLVFSHPSQYYTIAVGDKTATNAAWFYQNPTHPYEALANHVAFYPGKMDACFINDEQVQAQECDFYGGWITSDIVGPFKGGSGTFGW